MFTQHQGVHPKDLLLNLLPILLSFLKNWIWVDFFLRIYLVYNRLAVALKWVILTLTLWRFQLIAPIGNSHPLWWSPHNHLLHLRHSPHQEQHGEYSCWCLSYTCISLVRWILCWVCPIWKVSGEICSSFYLYWFWTWTFWLCFEGHAGQFNYCWTMK